jgi:hypothetical protein
VAFYNDDTKVRKTDQPGKYQVARKPGEKPSSPGIYKCQACGYEDVINRECGHLPPCAKCDKKPHTWKLLVTATDE